MSIAITDAITTLAEAEHRLQVIRNEDLGFFPEWQLDARDLRV